MNKDKFDAKLVVSGILIATYSILLYLLISRFEVVSGQIAHIVSMLIPFVYAIGLSYVLNLIVVFLEKNILSNTSLSRGKKRGLSIFLAYFASIIFIAVVLFFVVPQLGDSIGMLFRSLPMYTRQLIQMVNELLEQFDIDLTLSYINTLPWQDYLKLAIDWMTTQFSNIFQTTLGTTLGITNFLIQIVMAISISIYMLADKETLIFQMKRVVTATMPQKISSRLLNICTLTNLTVKKYLSGQLTECIVIGTLCFIGMLILNLPYALLVSTLIGVTALVPVIGPMIGNAISTFILLMVRPMHALVFFVFISILQQIDNSFIYPRIVGESIGLSGIWVLFAILVGGNLFGLVGVVMGIPFMAVLQNILSDVIHYLMNKRNLSDSDIS